MKVAGRLLLGLASFVFFKIMKLSVRLLVLLHYASHKSDAVNWQTSTAGTLERTGVLPMIMTTGPRWNTHAIVAVLGPITVNNSLVFPVAAPERSARYWTIVVTRYPSFRTAAWTSSMDAPFSKGVASLNLHPGKYSVALRYYHWSQDVALPAVIADDREVVGTVPVPGNLNDIYRDLFQRSNFFYSCLHYYVFVALRYRNLFPASFVEKEFLPAGNPETSFYYGALEAGESLGVELDPRVLTTHDVYFTAYSRSSFPLHWYQITEENHRSAPSTVPCTWLLRVHNHRKTQHTLEQNWVRTTVITTL